MGEAAAGRRRVGGRWRKRAAKRMRMAHVVERKVSHSIGIHFVLVTFFGATQFCRRRRANSALPRALSFLDSVTILRSWMELEKRKKELLGLKSRHHMLASVLYIPFFLKWPFPFSVMKLPTFQSTLDVDLNILIGNQ